MKIFKLCILFLGLAGAVSACGKSDKPGSASEDNCKKVIRHIADLSLKNMPPGVTLTEEMKQRSYEMMEKSPALEECKKTASQKEIECVLKAKDLNEVAKCDAKLAPSPQQ